MSVLPTFNASLMRLWLWPPTITSISGTASASFLSAPSPRWVSAMMSCAPSLFHLGNEALRRLHRGTEVHVLDVLLPRGQRRVRIRQAEDADFHATDLAHHIRLGEKLPSRAIGDIGGEHGKLCAGDPLAKRRRGEVRFMVADRHRVVADRVHQLEDRAAFGEVGDHGVAQRVAGIEQQDIRRLRAHLFHHGGDAVEAADRFAGEFALPSAPRADVAVEIVGVQDRDHLGVLSLRGNSRREQREEQRFHDATRVTRRS